jgi:hypothetical protein
MSSVNLLYKLGLSFEGMIRLADDTEEISLYATDN